MTKWSPWAAGVTKRLQVKVKQLKLEGLCKENIEDDEGDKVVVIVMKWKGPKAMLVPIPFFGTSTCQRDYTSQSCLRKGEPTEWEDEFESVCNFTIFKDGSFAPWDVTFNVLYVSLFFFFFLFPLILLMFDICYVSFNTYVTYNEFIKEMTFFFFF